MTIAQRLDGAEFSAAVTDIRLESESGGERWWQVALDRTAFVPGSAGVLLAQSRSGATLEIAVERVEQDADGELWHVLRKPLPVGGEVRGHVESSGAPES